MTAAANLAFLLLLGVPIAFVVDLLVERLWPR